MAIVQFDYLNQTKPEKRKTFLILNSLTHSLTYILKAFAEGQALNLMYRFGF